MPFLLRSKKNVLRSMLRSTRSACSGARGVWRSMVERHLGAYKVSTPEYAEHTFPVFPPRSVFYSGLLRSITPEYMPRMLRLLRS